MWRRWGGGEGGGDGEVVREEEGVGSMEADDN